MKIPYLNLEITRGKKENPQKVIEDSVKKKDPVIPPRSRVSEPSGKEQTLLGLLQEELKEITPEFTFEVIPQIRKLTKENPDFGQAIKNVINLGNTGHKIKFDKSVSPDQVDLMRKHLKNKSKKWAKLQGAAGMDGLVNRMIYQVMVGGSLVLEKVFANDFKQGIAQIPLIRVEKVRWVLDSKKGVYLPYEIINLAEQVGNRDQFLNGNLKKLNYNTLIYYGLYSDSEIPYGIPPYMPALPATIIQGKMIDNIDFIVEQMGLIGFLQLLLDKEAKRADENVEQYKARMNSILIDAANRVKKGLRDGINVGFKDDAEFQFHSATKSVSGVTDLFKENELQLLSGLGMDGSLMGRDYGSSESQITVVFMKMVSEFKNIQLLIKEALEEIYRDELIATGFKFDYLSVEFNKSTLQDEVKWQQGQQYKIANVQEKYLSGWISQETAADEMDYENPDQPEPRDIPSLAQKIVARQQAKDQKNADAKKTRDTDKPNPKSVKDKPRGRKGTEE